MGAGGGGERRLVERLIVPLIGASPANTTSGILPRDATDSAVMICVKPGPQVTDATPTFPVAR